MKIQSYIFLCCFSIIFVCKLSSQSNRIFDAQNAREGENIEYCFTHKKMQSLLQNQDFLTQYNLDEIAFNKALNKGSTLKGTVFKIPVVFHVLHNQGIENISDEQIYNALAILNRDFRKLNADTANVHPDFQGMPFDSEIEFVLATKAPNGTCFKGITRTQTSLTFLGEDGDDQAQAVREGNDVYIGDWPGNKYLNFFIAADIGGAAGYTRYPSQWSADDMTNGIWLLHTYVGSTGTSSISHSRVLTHECGHWLNLPHTWGSTNNPGEETSCDTDDNVADTPNCIGRTACILNSNTCDSDNAYWGFDIHDNVENYMEYSYCCKMFTAGQGARMRTAVQQTNTGRANLWSTANLIATGADGVLYLCKAEFSVDKPTICIGDEVQLTDDSYNLVSSWQWEITPTSGWSFSPGSSASSQNPSIIFNTSGLYSVKLIANDGSISDEELKLNYIRVAPEAAVLPFWEGFENYTSLINNNNWQITNFNNNNAFTIENTTSYSGLKCAKLINFGEASSSIDELSSSTIDLSSIAPTDTVTLSFRYSYRKRNQSNYEFLKVFISSNCGSSWAQRKTLGNNNLSPLVSSGFWIPSEESDWTTVHMTNVTSTYFTNNFKMKFRFEGNGGNNFYLDDINLYAGSASNDLVLGVQETATISSLELFPNPTEAEFNVQFNVEKQERLKFEIQDLAGKFVRQHFILANEGTNLVSFETSELSKGMYLLKISSASGAKTVQFIVN